MASLPAGVIVMRHGRRKDGENPDWQATARFPFDTPLTEREDEIGQAAKQLRGVAIDVAYTSPFRRCIETAERLLCALGRTDVPVFIHRGLSEVHTPRLLFRTRALTLSQTGRVWLWRATYRRHSRPLRGRLPIKARLLEEGDWPQLPEGEMAASLRFRDTTLQLAARHPGKRVLVVSHGRAVQVVHEALGRGSRLPAVGFAGFIACRPRPSRQQEPQQQQQQQQQQECDGGAQQQLHDHGQRQQGEGDAKRQAAGGAAAGCASLLWADFEPDPDVPPFGLYSEEPSDRGSRKFGDATSSPD